MSSSNERRSMRGYRPSTRDDCSNVHNDTSCTTQHDSSALSAATPGTNNISGAQRASNSSFGVANASSNQSSAQRASSSSSGFANASSNQSSASNAQHTNNGSYVGAAPLHNAPASASSKTTVPIPATSRAGPQNRAPPDRPSTDHPQLSNQQRVPRPPSSPAPTGQPARKVPGKLEPVRHVNVPRCQPDGFAAIIAAHLHSGSRPAVTSMSAPRAQKPPSQPESKGQGRQLPRSARPPDPVSKEILKSTPGRQNQDRGRQGPKSAAFEGKSSRPPPAPKSSKDHGTISLPRRHSDTPSGIHDPSQLPREGLRSTLPPSATKRLPSSRKDRRTSIERESIHRPPSATRAREPRSETTGSHPRRARS